MKRLKLLKLDSKEQYKDYFVKKYCNRKIYTFSGIRVKFYEDQFEHIQQILQQQKILEKDQNGQKNSPLITGSVVNLYTSFNYIKDYPIIIILHL